MSIERELSARVRPLAEEYNMFPKGGAVICAVSGGVDSVSLLHFLARLAPSEGFELHACHVNHSIRPEAEEDAAFVARQCAALGVPLHQTRVDVPALAKKRGIGLEEAGREARYHYFSQVLEEVGCGIGGDCVLATAHNADDNAETLLLHLVRGTGLDGLGGIPPRRDNLVRPFLQVPRSLIEAYAAELALPHVEDSTNADPTYSRNFLRARVMPLLKELNPNLTDSVTVTSALLRQDSDFMKAQALYAAQELRLAAGSVILPLECIRLRPDSISSRVFQMAYEKLMPDQVLSSVHRRALLRLSRSSSPSAQLDLPGGVVAQRVYTDLVFFLPQRVEILPPTELNFLGSQTIGPWLVTVERAAAPELLPLDGTAFYLPESDPVTLRPRQTGDKLKVPHRAMRKTLKNWMIDEKIPEARRSLIPVLEQNGQVAGVYGLGPEESLLPEPGTPCLHITIQKREDLSHYEYE